MRARRTQHLLLALLALVVVAGLNLAQGAAAAGMQTPASSGPDLDLAPLQSDGGEALRLRLQRFGTLPVIVYLDVPGYSVERVLAEGVEAATAMASIAQTRHALLIRLQEQAVAGGGHVSSVKPYEYVPYVAMIVDELALDVLYASPEVLGVEEDVPSPPALTDSVTLVRANFNHIAGFEGGGQTVAVLDTGVDRFHPALAGKVVSEACYSSNVASQGASSLCPGGVTSTTASNSGLNCNAAVNGCDHGTHVAGIVAGAAPAANLIAIQVFSRFTDGGGNTFCADANRTSPCTLTYNSDQIAALNRVYGLRNTFNIASVNMSLGGGRFTGACNTDNRKASIDLLRGANIATVISAGNNSFTNAMGAPGCISTAISVAATTKTDQVANYSNLSSSTTLMAPGSNIVAAVPGNATASKNGTSMAAPHVAGVIATLKQGNPNLTVAQIVSFLTSTGPQVTDQRSGGSVTKRRLDAWTALCAVITCDADDFRTIGINQTLNGTINPASDVDIYYFQGQAGQRLTLRMNRSSGTVDPYLELFSPSGVRVAMNDNGGGGVNALINGYLLPQNGLYRIRARGVSGAGGYTLNASSAAVPLNPTPRITRLSPTAATATIFGSDFWVAIYGEGFMPESQVRWNGALRSSFYSRNDLIYIRVRGSDINFPAPRLAFISVSNPTPGGGTSNAYPFSINFPFLGESELVAPEAGSSVPAGIAATFVISWTHPSDSWRTMQSMDMRLRDENDRVAAWVRVVEQPGPASFYRLLNAADEVVGEGLPGDEGTLVLTDTVTLHLDQSSFFGSGRTATMTATLTFDERAAGLYNIEFQVNNPDGEVQADDVLGTFAVTPAVCAAAVEQVELQGVVEGLVDTPYAYTATVTPANATPPLTYTWAPEPASGQGTAAAVYAWPEAGQQVVFVSVENCGSFVADIAATAISTGEAPDLNISKWAPATAVAGEPFTYTLTVTNHGAAPATTVNITDALPAGAVYVEGGDLIGGVVNWNVAELDGYAAEAQVSYQVTASADLSNAAYGAIADGGYSASGAAVSTLIVHAQTLVSPVAPSTLAYASPALHASAAAASAAVSATLSIPPGAVFAPTVLAYTQLDAPTAAPGAAMRFAGRAFRLDAAQENELAPDLTLGEAVQLSLTYREEEVTGLNTLALRLLAWDGGAWTSEGIACEHDQEARLLDCEVTALAMGEYALFEVTHRTYLPMSTQRFEPDRLFALITGIQVAQGRYVVNFQTYGFQPVLPGMHVHFFFNTVPPEDAGLPGPGPWFVYGGGSPFTGYTVGQRPAAATQLCVLVANPNHTIILGSGNCYDLPDV